MFNETFKKNKDFNKDDMKKLLLMAPIEVRENFVEYLKNNELNDKIINHQFNLLAGYLTELRFYKFIGQNIGFEFNNGNNTNFFNRNDNRYFCNHDFINKEYKILLDVKHSRANSLYRNTSYCCSSFKAVNPSVLDKYDCELKYYKEQDKNWTSIMYVYNEDIGYDGDFFIDLEKLNIHRLNQNRDVLKLLSNYFGNNYEINLDKTKNEGCIYNIETFFEIIRSKIKTLY